MPTVPTLAYSDDFQGARDGPAPVRATDGKVPPGYVPTQTIMPGTVKSGEVPSGEIPIWAKDAADAQIDDMMANSDPATDAAEALGALATEEAWQEQQ